MNDKDAKDTPVQNKNINYLHQKLYRTYIDCLFVLWCLSSLSTIFQFFVVISFIDGENWRI